LLKLYKSLATRLCTGLHKSMAGSPLLTYAGDLVFANASSRYLLDPITPAFYGPFAPNVLASCSIGGKTFGQFEGERKGCSLYTERMDQWSPTNVTTATDTDTSPAGTLTADKIIGTNQTAVMAIGALADSGATSAYWAITAWIKYTNRRYVTIRGYTDTTKWFCATFDLVGGTCTQTAKGASFPALPTIAIILEPTYGFHYLSVTDATGVEGIYPGILFTDSATPALDPNTGAPTATDDGTGYYTAWGLNSEKAAFPSSYIYNNTSLNTRAADSAYFPSASVPAAFKTVGFKIPLINKWAETEPAGDLVVFATDANNYLKWDNTAKTYALYIGGVKKMESNALALDRDTLHELEMNLVTGNTKMTGAKTGDGINAGTPCNIPAGNLYWGGDHAGANQYFGLIQEPEAL
jgi:hypothetical protein